MKLSVRFWVSMVFLILLAIPGTALPEVKISLKNGMDIIADSCIESGDKLVCEKMGGTFEIDKNDVLETKGITVHHAPPVEEPQDAGQAPGPPREEQGKGVPDLKAGQKQPEAAVNGLNPEDMKKLEQINKRKTELQAEREKLVGEQEQLNEDLKNQVNILSRMQYNAILDRINDLKARISRFNDEVNSLNEEGRRIVEKGNRKRQD